MIFESFSGANQAVFITVFISALVMGAVANKTNFCTMGAVSDLVNMGMTGRLRAWVLAMAVALIGVVVMESFGGVSFDITRPPYRSANFAWLEYLLGGFIFGIGMTLGSGCGHTTLIRLGGGNLKSIIVFSAIAVSAYFMVNPFPGSDKTLYSELFYYWMSPLSASLTTPQDLGSVFASMLGTDKSGTRMWAGIIIAILMLAYVFKARNFRKNYDNILAGFIVGLSVVVAWYASSSLVTINMEDEAYSWVQFASTDVWSMMAEGPQPRAVAIQSFTFINPTGETLGYIMSKFDSHYLTFGVIAVLGVLAGSFLWAVVSRKFRFEWFASFKDFVSHVIGGTLMGIGGVLALGCTIGQAITGISTLSMGSVLAFAGIFLGCYLTMKVQYYTL